MPGSAGPQRRARGEIERLPSGSLRVRVYDGVDPVTKKRRYLVETVPAGPEAAHQAERVKTRLLEEVEERRTRRTRRARGARASTDVAGGPPPAARTGDTDAGSAPRGESAAAVGGGRRRKELTVAAIARLAGVSPPTVSKVLNGRAGVAPATRRRVEKLDDRLVRAGVWFSFEDGFAHARDLLRLADPPTAVVCGNDLQAFGVYEAARQAGARIPDELSVVGFDDISYARWCGPPLTTVQSRLPSWGPPPPGCCWPWPPVKRSPRPASSWRPRWWSAPAPRRRPGRDLPETVLVFADRFWETAFIEDRA